MQFFLWYMSFFSSHPFTFLYIDELCLEALHEPYLKLWSETWKLVLVWILKYTLKSLKQKQHNLSLYIYNSGWSSKHPPCPQGYRCSLPFSILVLIFEIISPGLVHLHWSIVLAAAHVMRWGKSFPWTKSCHCTLHVSKDFEKAIIHCMLKTPTSCPCFHNVFLQKNHSFWNKKNEQTTE